MATQIGGTIVWNLDVDDSKFQSGLNKAKSQAESFSKDVDKEFTGLKGRITNAFSEATQGSQMFAQGLLAVGAATIAAAGFGIKYAADLETMTQGFITLLGSAEKANAAISMIQSDAAKTPFEFKGLVDANFMLTSVTKNAERSEKLLLNIGKALTASGKSGAELDRIIVNLQQIANVGKITELDIRQFGFAGINILELLADYYGTTKEAASDMIKDSKDAFADLEGAFRKAGEGGGRFSRAFIDQAGTMNQLWSNFKDNISITASQLVKSLGIFDATKTALKGMVDALSFFASPQGTKIILDFFAKINEWLPVIVGGILGGLVPAFVALGIAIWGAFAPLIPFIAAGALLGAAVKLIIDAFGGWNNVVKRFNAGIDFIKGKLKSVEPVFVFIRDRIGQIFEGFGISGQFGGLQNTFKGLADSASFYSERALQILGEFWQKAKNFLAFGNTGGEATIVQALQGIYNRIKPLLDALQPVFDKIGANLALTGQIIQTQLKPAFDALVEASKPLIEALSPMVLDFIKKAFIGLAVAIGGAIALILGVITGLVTGLANALPYIAQALEGLVQFIRGIVQIITGILTGDLGLAWEGIKQAVKGVFDFFVNGFMAILKFISGFVQGVVAFFQGLYNTLVGNSIVPDMINAIVMWFTGLPGRVYNALASLVTNVIQAFTETWNAVTETVGQWIKDVKQWGENIIKAFADGIKGAGQFVYNAITGVLNEAKKLLKGNSPPIEGPFKNIDTWGQNVGRAWVEGLESAISQLSLTNPFEPVVPAVATAPAVSQQGGRGNIERLVNIEHMEVREESDITDVARELGFRIETSSGFTENG